MGPTAMERRRYREEDATSPVGAYKKRRVEQDQHDGSDVSEQVGATELASAFALASLATLSPRTPLYQPLSAPEAREGADYGDEDDEEQSMASTEMRSPKEEPAPITPEVRSPIRSNKKVTFAPDIKDHERLLARRHQMPPRIKREQGSRMPPGFRGRAVFSNRLGPPHQGPPMPWMRQRRMMSPPGFMPPPPAPPPPPPMQTSCNRNQWICDFCNVASFATYQEACIHEESCSVRCGIPPRRPPMWHALSPPQHIAIHPMASMSMDSQEETHHHQSSQKVLPSSSSREWFQGSMCLSVPASDSDWLSDLNCFVRANCVEAFSATGDQVNKTSKRGRITLHQVGIRCRFCSHRPVDERAVAAISFPTSVAGIYESVKRWQRVHFEACEDIPNDVRGNISRLATANVWIPTTRQYWADSARAIGMVDTEDGIRFAVDPNASHQGQQRRDTPNQDESDIGAMEMRTAEALFDGKSIVYAEDLNLVPPYVFFLMSQVESCHFTEADRFVARSKGPVGYPGFQCRHCNGHAGLGKYFPVSSKSLSTNSTSQNIHAHLLKCRKCPPELKRRLIDLKEEKSKAPRLEPGWRKVFFDKVWARMHGQKP